MYHAYTTLVLVYHKIYKKDQNSYFICNLKKLLLPFKKLIYLDQKQTFQMNISLPLFLWQVVGLNFSSATTPELMLKTFDHYCEYRRTPNGVVLSPVQLGKWLVVFCDEINLPDMDRYGEHLHCSVISVG